MNSGERFLITYSGFGSDKNMTIILNIKVFDQLFLGNLLEINFCLCMLKDNVGDLCPSFVPFAMNIK